jgi:chromosome partitioning protein
MKKAKIISVVNQKGGVGKTTTAINLGTALAAIYKNILIIDLDPQGNASTGLGISNKERVNTIYDVLINDVNIKDAILNTEIPYLDLIPSTVDLAGAEVELISKNNREYKLKEEILSCSTIYDYIIIDCPPSLGLLTLNALIASDSLIIPLQCEFFALEGLSHLLKTISIIQKKLHSTLKVEGIVLTMYDKRNRLSEQVEKDVRSCLGELVFNTVIPRNIRVSEAPSHGKPTIIYDLKCAGSLAYINLAKEILEKEEKNDNESFGEASHLAKTEV